MADPPVAVFFYGSYMNPRVLAEVDLVPGRMEAARLSGWDIAIRPLANLVRSDRDSVWGVLATATHAELERLYAHARDVLGGRYLPFPVLVEARDARLEPALCYVAPAMSDAAPRRDYVERIVAPAEAHGFPEWYLQRLRSFAEDAT